MNRVDIAVIGAGIAGAALSSHLARAGLRVALFDAEGVGAGASGRNAGSLIPPSDPRLLPYYQRTRALLDGIAGEHPTAAPRHCGLLGLTLDAAHATTVATVLNEERPEIEAVALDVGALRASEPAVGDAVAAVRLEAAHTVDPLEVTRAFAAEAVTAGTVLVEGAPARIVSQNGRVVGVHAGEESYACDVVVVCTGAETPAGAGPDGLVSTTAVWGVVASMRLPEPPSSILVAAADLAPAVSAQHGVTTSEATSIGFGLVTHAGVSSLGHSLGADRPDVPATVERLLDSAQRYLPEIRATSVQTTRVCARPTSADDLPVLGPIPGLEGAFAFTGLGSRGLTIGPALAAVLGDALLGRSEVPAVFDPVRFTRPHPQEVSKA